MRKLIKKIIVFISAIAMSCLLFFTLISCVKVESDGVQKFTLEGDLKVGILSDSQLPQTENDPNQEFVTQLKTSFMTLKAQNVNVILYPGDITNSSSDHAMGGFMDIFKEVFPDDDTRPILQTIMGNHDFWSGGSAYNCIKTYEDNIGQSPWTHYVINDMSFIGLSPTNGNMKEDYTETKEWFDAQMVLAEEMNPGKPVFVQSHNAALGTTYGSDDWGDASLNKILSPYHNIINIVGHTHYSILDERSIHQGEYTTINTQSVSYTELEEGKVNGTKPPGAHGNLMGYVMNVTSDNIEVVRLDLTTGDELKTAWDLGMPTEKEHFIYTNEARISNNEAPVIGRGAGSTIIEDEMAYIIFDAATDDDFVHTYKLVWSDETETLYFSDFITGIDKMNKNVKLPIYGKSAGTYSVKVYAIDSWGAVSKNFIEITNVVVRQNDLYVFQK